MIEKSSKKLHEKRLIAKYAARLVEEGDCIYLDAGSTIIEMFKFLTAKDIVVVTNGLMHVAPLINKRNTTYLIDGFVESKTNTFIGRGSFKPQSLSL